MLYPFLAVHRSLLPLHYAFRAMLYPLLPMLYPLLPMLHPLAPMLHPLAAVLHAFAATRCEGEDAVHEESFGHHVRHGVPDPYRARGSERVGSSSERATTLPVRVGMRREQLATPHEERTMPAAKPRRPREHPPSLLSRPEARSV